MKVERPIIITLDDSDGNPDVKISIETIAEAEFEDLPPMCRVPCSDEAKMLNLFLHISVDGKTIWRAVLTPEETEVIGGILRTFFNQSGML